MSRITGVTLLLIILVVSFYHSTASTNRPIHVCGCTVRATGKLLCLKQQKANSVKQIEDLGKCLCSKLELHMFKTACERFRIQSRLSHIPSTPL